eukprot:gnl/TRDRNA2_/TRDRNA2_36163_c0_seq1.p1 gnl/TRDRNA2_/TRDRNA2_36163_c0~~gnl/TRDRNA2_/TRDRNA2_36163_c0_seq1.p1  ORF type:complete len:346 (-),score=54.18 gnl/TRDRNA2_/TRDRNA2_36163_c0_seq1:93-1079(-)
MVPLEAETTTPEAEADAPTASSGPAAPISVLSKLALKDAVLELEATCRHVRSASSTAALSLWHTVERRLGLEVGIDDPALKELFGLHVVTVEELCLRVRAQGDAFLSAVDAFCKPSLASSAAALKLLAGGTDAGAGLQSAELEADLADASHSATTNRARVEARVQREVFGPISQRIAAHEAIREDLRERQRWRVTLNSTMADTVRLKKVQGSSSSNESGLKHMNGIETCPVEQATLRLRDAMQRVAEFDEKIFTGLHKLKDETIDTVRRPWAALLQIQSEYFLTQQAAWVSLAESFVDFGAEPGVAAADVGVATPHAASSSHDVDCYY